MRRIMFFAFIATLLMLSSSARAADAITSTAPGLPDFAGNGSLPADMPLPGLDLPGTNPQASPTAAVTTTVSTSSAPVSQEAAPTAIPTTVPTALAAEAASPVATVPASSPTVVAEVASSTTTVETALSPTPTVVTAAAADATTALEGLEAYFPMTIGAKWNYRNTTGQTRTVECLSREIQGKMVAASFRVTTANIPLTQSWKLVDGKIVLAAELTTIRAGWIRLVAPQGKTVPRWVYDRRGGTVSYYKQEVAPVQAAGKKYAEGLVVTERTLKGAEQVSLRKWFYAKGVGLVAEAAYDASGAALPDQGYELQSAQ
jgi:hypothetical protein